MRVKSEDILKPGTVLEVKEIDWSDPEVKAIVAESEKAQAESKRLSRFTQEYYDNLRQVITI